MYSNRDELSTNKEYFEKRYLNGLINNLQYISNNYSDWKIVVYIDNNLEKYYSTFHKSLIIDLLSKIKLEITLVYTKNMMYPITYALERYRALSLKYDILAVRDCDQEITKSDFDLINDFIKSDYDTMLYKSRQMTFSCLGGGFTTKKSCPDIFSDITFHQYKYKYIDEYISQTETTMGYDEFFITICIDCNLFDVGKKLLHSLNFRKGSWYDRGKAVFILPDELI